MGKERPIAPSCVARAALAILLLAPACRTADDPFRAGHDGLAIPSSRVFAGLGYRGYDDSWEPFDDQFAFLLSGQHQRPDAALGIEWGFGFASDDAEVGGQRLLSSSVDLSVGPTKTLPLDGEGRFFLNLGAGAQVSFAYEEVDHIPQDTEEDEWLGGYAHASLYWRAGWNWDVGIDLRWVTGGDLDLTGDPREGEYFQVLLGTGFAW